MKLATLADGSRDGRLAVVSRDLSRAAFATGIAATLQAALDDWKQSSAALEKLARSLESGGAEAFAFDPARALAPLPRAYHWVDGSAYVNHVELVRKARGATMPESFWSDPLVYQGGSDDLLPPTRDAAFGSEDWGIDMEGEVAARFLQALLSHKKVKPLLSDEHFSVDGTLIEAWASHSSFRPKDDSDDSDGTDFHGEKRCNDTHASVTDPDARLYKKSAGKEAKLSYMGHALMENRHGLAVDGMTTHATGTAEREAAEAMLRERAKRGRRG